MMRSAVCLSLSVLLVAGGAAAELKDLDHPFLLWTRQEAAGLRRRIESDPAAGKQYQRMRDGQISKGNPTLWNLFNYLVMGDQAAGQREKAALLGFIGRVPEPLSAEFKAQAEGKTWNEGMPSFGDRHMRDEQTLNTLRYDVLYDELSAQERAGVEKSLRTYIQFHLDGHKPWHPAFKYDRTSWLPNMHWPRAIGTHLMAVALKDARLIEAMFGSQGGLKWYLDEYLADGRFYMEEFGKYYSNIGTLLMYCEALERLRLSQYGYGYTGKGPGEATVRKYLEMMAWTGFPRLEAPPGGMGQYPGVLMGDAGDSILVAGYDAKGKGGNSWWSNSHMNGPLPKLLLPGWFEVCCRRFPDGRFDYFLAQLRAPGEDVYLPSLYWGLGPIDPGKVQPPPAPSYVARERGFAMLRAEEGPAYWESPAPAVAMQFGMYYVHYVHDCFSILRYVSHNRMIYTRMGKGTKVGYAGGDEWRDHVRGHCGVVVDGLKAQPVDRGNNGAENHRIRQHLTGPARFVAARARGVYPDVDQERALVLTREYLFDAFWLDGGRDRTYDWQVLTPGQLQGLADGAWKPAEAWTGGRSVARPQLEHIHVMDAGDRPWAAAVLQDAEPGGRGVGVRVSMLPEAGTLVLGSKPPGIGQAGSGVSLLVTRRKPATVFAALHEPFEGGPGKRRARAFERIQQTEHALAARISGDGLDDRVLLAIGDGAGKAQTLSGDGESFTFTDFAHVRVGKDAVEACGDISAMRLRVQGSPGLIINGKRQQAAVSGGVLSFPAAP